jgi:hypothetical protein
LNLIKYFKAINFYEELLKKYEQKFEFNLKNATFQCTADGEDRLSAVEEELSNAIIMDEGGLLPQINKVKIRK